MECANEKCELNTISASTDKPECTIHAPDMRICGYKPLKATKDAGADVPLDRPGYALPTERDKNEMPEPGINILAIVRHWYTGGKRFAVLWIVDKPDGCYRTVDDNSELSHDWDVIAWDYLPELRKKA